MLYMLWIDSASGLLLSLLIGLERIVRGRVIGSKLGTAPLSNSWMIIVIWLYIALNRTPNIDCYWMGGSTQVPKRSECRILKGEGFSTLSSQAMRPTILPRELSTQVALPKDMAPFV